jgi:hypothetical protein
LQVAEVRRVPFDSERQEGIRMRIRQCFAIACGVVLAAGTALAADQAGSNAASSAFDGLFKVESKRFDELYLRPGADFRGYTKILLDPTQVAFARNWIADMNAARIALMQGTTVEDAERIAASMRTGFGEIFSNAFKRAGYEIVTKPGTDVLGLSLRAVDVYINAPETVTLSLPSRVYTRAAGEATLALEVRDSATGKLLWRVVDHRTAGDRGAFRSSFMITSPVSNRSDFGSLFDIWARDSVASLDELKAQSPLAIGAQAQQH